jgi:hypothetical protein
MGAEPAGARHRQLDLAQLGQQMPPVAAVAPVGRAAPSHLLEMPVDRPRHLILHDLAQRPSRRRAVVLAPLQTLDAHRLHHLERSR